MTIVHINRNRVVSNNKHKINEPVIAIRKTKASKAAYAHEVIIHGPSRLISSPDLPLKCGAKYWIETDAEVELITDPRGSRSELQRDATVCSTDL